MQRPDPLPVRVHFLLWAALDGFFGCASLWALCRWVFGFASVPAVGPFPATSRCVGAQLVCPHPNDPVISPPKIQWLVNRF